MHPENTFVPASVNPSKKVEINLYTDEFYGNYKKSYTEDRAAFIEYLENEFGIVLNVEGIGTKDFTRDTIEGFNGLIRILKPALDNYAESGLISPMTGYLADNDTWNSLPKYFTDNCMQKGEVWGIPAVTQVEPIFFVRFIRNDWLDSSGLEMPETLEEYYECMKQFTYQDPDNNGLNDTIGFTGYGLHSLSDIFNSFDCRMPPASMYRLAWDPNKNIFVDGLQSRYAYDCLSYLNSCYTEGMLAQNFHNVSQFAVRDEFNYGKIGSIAAHAGNHDEFEKNLDTDIGIITGLEGNVKKNITPVLTYGAKFYVLSSAAENKNDVVNKFVDTFLGNEKGYFSAKYGLSDANEQNNGWYLDGEKIILNIEVNNGRLSKTVNPGLIEGHPVFSKYEIIYSQMSEGEYPTNVMSLYDKNLSKRILADDDGKIYHVSNRYDFMSDPDYFIITGKDYSFYEIGELGTNLITDCIRGKVDIDEALDEYREYTRKIGLDDVLVSVNEDVHDKKY